MDRRKFIKSSLELTSLGVLAPSVYPLSTFANLLSSKNDDHFFVLINMKGGWDVTLSLDPWTEPVLPDPKDMFIEYRHEDLTKINENMYLGPAMSELKSYSNNFSIVNGVFLSFDDNGHIASETFMTTGKSSGKMPSFPITIAEAKSYGPLGVLFDSSIFTAESSIPVSATSDLLELKNNSLDFNLLKSVFENSVKNSSYVHAVKKTFQSKKIFYDFKTRLNEIPEEKISKDYSVIAASFLAKGSNSAMITINKNLDSHADHEKNHLREQKEAWGEVKEIFDYFKSIKASSQGESLFDKTTFMVVSEFARTPQLNAAKGKDHNPRTNSVLLAGKGIHKSQVIGASRLITQAQSPIKQPYHIALPYDFSNNKVTPERSPRSELIYPGHIVKTLARLFDIKDSQLPGIKAKPITSLLERS